jgi:AcrR family transcriptional regulator
VATVKTGRPGRPAAASRGDALALAGQRFLSGERVDMLGVARDLGLARATMHRWFGTREQLLGETIAGLAERRLEVVRARIHGNGATALLACFDAFNRDLAATEGLRVLLAAEQERAMRILTSSGGIVQPRMVLAIKRVIDAEVDNGSFESPVATQTLAYAIVRLAEAFLYNDARFGIRGDTERLREVEAALLGVS